jgi:hypothetical protein
MDQQRPMTTDRLSTIRGQMVELFTLEELRDLAFDLGLVKLRDAGQLTPSDDRPKQ